MGHFNDMYYCYECGKFTNNIFHIGDGDLAICAECIYQGRGFKKNKKSKKRLRND